MHYRWTNSLSDMERINRPVNRICCGISNVPWTFTERCAHEWTRSTGNNRSIYDEDNNDDDDDDDDDGDKVTIYFDATVDLTAPSIEQQMKQRSIAYIPQRE